MTKIMVVDDNPDLLFMIKKGLERIDETYKVSKANGGKECFELLKRGDMPDIILLDIMMPEINGWDVFAKLKENHVWKKIPVVFLTAKIDVNSKVFGINAADDYITKPFEIHELKVRIEKIMGM